MDKNGDYMCIDRIGGIIMGLFNKYKDRSNGSSVEWLVVGLGNPGGKYTYTRHNCGWLTIDRWADKLGIKINRVKFKSLVSEAVISGKKCLIMKPTTMMNASGEAVVEAMNFYKVPIENVLVISDDVSLDCGKIRIRRKGSDGGQKGLRSIITLTGSDNFPRIKCGVGEKPHPDYDMAAWVLSNFTDGEKKQMLDAFDNAVAAGELIIAGNTDRAMNLYN